MSIVKNICVLFWRVWFLLCIFTSLILLIPIVAVIISREKWHPIYCKIARIWSKAMLFLMGFKVQIDFVHIPTKNKSYVFCPNHTSMIDILLLFSISKSPFIFVGKKEIGNIPLIGYIYKRTSILVDRNNKNSKVAVFDAAKNSIKKNLSLCIFPEGKVPDDESVVSDHFQNGAFRLAIENQMPIVPITIFDSKKRFSYDFLSGGPGVLRLKIHKPISTLNRNLADKNRLKNETFQVIHRSLVSDKSYMKSSGKKSYLK